MYLVNSVLTGVHLQNSKMDSVNSAASSTLLLYDGDGYVR